MGLAHALIYRVRVMRSVLGITSSVAMRRPLRVVCNGDKVRVYIGEYKQQGMLRINTELSGNDRSTATIINPFTCLLLTTGCNCANAGRCYKLFVTRYYSTFGLSLPLCPNECECLLSLSCP